MIRPTALEFIAIIMVPPMKVNGKTISNKEEALKDGQTAQYTRESTSKAKSMDMACTNGMMASQTILDQASRASGMKTKSKAW